MTTEPDHIPPIPLSVLNPSDKVEQLRREFAKAALTPPPTKLAEQTLVERALDVSLSARQKMIKEKVIDVVRTIFDPEIPVNVFDLGLIYDIGVGEDDRVKIRMTLTAPACPVAGAIVAEVEKKVENIDEVKSATVELVWDPPWGKERMSEAALLELGLL